MNILNVKMRDVRGFTLIELLVVIAIIGVLSTIVLASLNSARTKGRDAKRVADVKQLQLALELYYDANSAYPAAISGTELTGPGHIPAVPLDPTDETAYPYDLTAGGTYELGANLETDGHSALASDSDAPVEVVVGDNLNDGSDDDGCAGEVGRYCYNVVP